MNAARQRQTGIQEASVSQVIARRTATLSGHKPLCGGHIHGALLILAFQVLRELTV
jgi:hypothetical protein